MYSNTIHFGGFVNFKTSFNKKNNLYKMIAQGRYITVVNNSVHSIG